MGANVAVVGLVEGYGSGADANVHGGLLPIGSENYLLVSTMPRGGKRQEDELLDSRYC
ncbi:hypothetical protein ARTHRO9V_150280 [Arthrobacter sp. 9V]|nr:hypothetical protein ARTHRO9V_150280 [Arthrobacter sp. 9V]